MQRTSGLPSWNHFRRVLLLLLFLLPVRASAQPSQCGQAITAWVEQASQASGRSFSLRQCKPSMVWIDLPNSEGLPPLTVELSEGEGPAFRRVGAFRLAPVMNGDWGNIPSEQRAAFDALSAWIEKHPQDVSLAEKSVVFPTVIPKTSIPPPHAVPWRLAAALVLAGLGWFFARASLRCSARVGAALASLAVLALGLRGGLGLWGPYHINGQGPLWVEMAWRGTILSTYGAGYPEIFHGLTSLGATPDTPIFAANAVLSSLLPVLLVIIARLLGASWAGASVIGLALAIDPISIHMAATESYFVPIQAMLLAAVALGGAARKALQADQLVGAAALSLSAGLTVAQLFRMHPLAWPLLSALPFFWAGVQLREMPLKQSLRDVALLGVLSLLTAAMALGTDALVPVQEIRQHPASTGAFPLTVVLLALLAGALFLFRRYRLDSTLGGMASISTALGFAWVTFLLFQLRAVYDQSQVWQRSFDVAYLLLLAALLAGLVAPRNRQELALFALPFLIFFAHALHKGNPTTTEVREYRWLRAELAKLDSKAILIYAERSGQRVLTVPEYVLPGSVPTEIRSVRLSPEQAVRPWLNPDASYYYYLHGSLCDGVDQREVCAGFEKNFRLSPLATFTTQAIPSHDDCPYQDPTVTLILSQIKGMNR